MTSYVTDLYRTIVRRFRPDIDSLLVSYDKLRGKLEDAAVAEDIKAERLSKQIGTLRQQRSVARLNAERARIVADNLRSLGLAR